MLTSYQYYKNTRNLLEQNNFGCGYYLSELIMITNKYSNLIKLGRQVENTKQQLYQKLCKLSKDELQKLRFVLEYAIYGSQDFVDRFKCYKNMQTNFKIIQLSKIEFEMLCITIKYYLEKEMPFKFDDFILKEYNNLLKRFIETETIITNDSPNNTVLK